MVIYILGMMLFDSYDENDDMIVTIQLLEKDKGSYIYIIYVSL